MKPTHMIGGYAHLAWGFNYYGTASAPTRDEFVIVAEDERSQLVRQGGRGFSPRPGRPPPPRVPPLPARRPQKMKIRAQIAMVAETSTSASAATPARSPARTCGPTARGSNYVWFNNVRDQAGHRLSQGLGEPGDRWQGGWTRNRNGKITPRQGSKWRIFGEDSSPTRTCRRIDDFYEPLHLRVRVAPEGAGAAGPAVGQAALAGHRRGDQQDRMVPPPPPPPGNWGRTCLGGEFSKAAAATTTLPASRRRSTANSRRPS